MAFELILTNKRLRQHPLLMLSVGFAAVTIATFLSWKIFPGSSSLVLIAFTIIPLVPLMMKLFEYEESLHTHTSFRHKHAIHSPHSFVALHRSKVLSLYAYLLAGLILGFFLWNLILPSHVAEHIFEQQHDALYDFDGPVGFAVFDERDLIESCDGDIIISYIPENFGGCFIADYNKDGFEEYIIFKNDNPHAIIETQKYAKSPATYQPTPYKQYLFWHILQNNFTVLIFVFLTSFIYGAGALFILTWNASIIAYFFAELMRGSWGFLGIFNTLLHGVPELLGFLLASIAGGVLSVAFIRHNFMDKKFKLVFKDSCVLFLIALVFLVGAAGIEII